MDAEVVRRLRGVWYGMRSRCYRESSAGYRYYGGRGIRVCDAWRDESDAFMGWGLANGYALGLTLDRIDPDKDYSPDNCRWIPRSENSARARVTQARRAASRGNILTAHKSAHEATRSTIVCEATGQEFRGQRSLAAHLGVGRKAVAGIMAKGETPDGRKLSYKKPPLVTSEACLAALHSRRKPVVRAEDGEAFDSLTEAAAASGVTPATLCAALKNTRRTAGGYHWRYA